MQEWTGSFGYWLRRRRKALDLTQEALGQRVSCSGFTIRKIEADERRPSRGLAERLSTALAIPDEERRAFLDAARGLHATSRLPMHTAVVESGIPSSSSTKPGTSPAVAAKSAKKGAASDTSPFVGRHNEYDKIVRLIEGLGAGIGGSALIDGEPGIGKSRLLREVTRYIDALGLPLLATNCFAIEHAMPYQPVIDLISRVLDRIPDAAVHNLPPVSLAELSTLVPEIGDRFPDLPQLSNDFPEARQARLARAVDQLLEAYRGGHPLVLMVDDMQWADDASARVFHYLARHATQRAVLVIYAYRDEAVDSDERFAQLIESLRRDTSAYRLSLGRLDFSDTQSLVVTTLASAKLAVPDLAERLYRETDGNPFFLISILQSLSDGEMRLDKHSSDASELLPDTLRAAVRVRLSHVPKSIRPLLDTAAVLGRRFDFDTLLDVTREPEAQLLDAVEELVKRHLLREESDEGVYDFCHDKLREVVYRDISSARRKSLHRGVAESLERLQEGASHERDAQLAEHYERAHVWNNALHYLLRAADQSRNLFAMRDALHWLDRAIALCESHPEVMGAEQLLEIHEKRGVARAQAGQTQGAVADMRRVIDALRASGEREKTRVAMIQLGMAYRRADQYDEATACLTEALRESRLMNDERQAADTLYHLGTVAWSTGKNHQAISFHQQAVEMCEQKGFVDLVAVQAYHGRGEAYFADARPVAAIECYTRSLELARGIGDKSYESENLMMIGHACIGSKGIGDYCRATQNFEQALEIAREADLQWHFGPTLLGLDHVRACTGSYGEAWNGMQQTLRWLESLEQVRYQFIAIDCIGHLLLDLGLNKLAIEHLERGLALGRSTGILFWNAALNTHLALARSRLGEGAEAAALHATLEQTRRMSERYMLVGCLAALAEIALTAGDIRQCRAYADELLDLSTVNGLRELEGVARRWRGEAMLLDKDYLSAQAELSRAVLLAEDVRRIRLQLDTQAALSRLADAQGQSVVAQRHRDKVRSIGSAMEMSLASTGLKAHFGIN